MPSTKTLFANAIAVSSTTALLLGVSAGPAGAEPPSPTPGDSLQAPGLPAVESLGPVIQNAAGDPNNAASMLMAAAQAFANKPGASPATQNVASAVSQFVSDPGAAPAAAAPGGSGPAPSPSAAATPVAHVPAPGAIPGTQAHLPPGVDPAHSVGPPAPPEAAAPPPAPVAEAAAASPPPAPAPAAPPPPAPEGAPAPQGAAQPGFGPDAPPVQEFMYPSIGKQCLSDGGNVLATAMSVAGPADIPKPGPKAGQTAYVFTAVGTPGPAEEQKLPLNVTWVNLTTGDSGGATLKPRPDINPDGPTTLTAVVDTGSGSIMSTIFGQVTTTEKQCQFMPTIGSTVVP